MCLGESIAAEQISTKQAHRHTPMTCAEMPEPVPVVTVWPKSTAPQQMSAGTEACLPCACVPASRDFLCGLVGER